MIDQEFIASLIRLLDESSLDNLEIERGGTRIRLSKSPEGTREVGSATGLGPAVQPDPAAPAPAAAATPGAAETEGTEAAASAASRLVDVTSPMVGTFYRSPAPDAEAYVEVGKHVAVGDVLCIIEAMKLMNELESETAGVITEISVENGEPVEYGQVLFRIDPA